ncbi:MAG TPA: reverse transcriptase/maturase family protein, partial [Candidatus Wallbacteria bacterium]|nr:reverse transcriptase/maturase family protein [Candidatus Wallbacteria bacterium]
RRFKVMEPKERLICAASFPERVLHHAIINICEPVFERYAIFDSFACRKFKGSHVAVKRAFLFARRSQYYLKLDIAKYFESIDHEVLNEKLKRIFKDRQLLILFEKIIASYETASAKGLPIGNLTSQHFANFYLGPLDHYIKENLGRGLYIRYMDDFITFGESKDEMKSLLKLIRAFLRTELRLELKNDIRINENDEGIEFLGYRIYPDKIRLSRRSARRFKRKFIACEKKLASNQWSEREYSRHMEPLIAFTKVAGANAFRAAIISKYGAAA